MAMRKYKPTSPGRRFRSVSTFEEVTKTEPEKSLLEPREEEGRPQQQGPHHHPPPGRRPQAPLPDDRLQADEGRRAGEGGGDRVRPEPLGADRPAPLRGRRQGLHPRAGAACGSGSRSSPGPNADIRPGNALPLANIPTGTLVHNVELKPGKGGQLARSAGSGIQLVAKDDGFAVLRLPSGEMRRVPLTCRATVGQVGNVDHENISSGKAGRSRWLGKRPTVRGSAMNPVDHPARRRRGQVEGRPAPGHALGRARRSASARAEAQGVRQADRPRPPPRQGKAVSESRSRRRRGRSSRSGSSANRGDEHVGRRSAWCGRGRARRRSSRRWSATRSPSTTAASTCPCS